MKETIKRVIARSGAQPDASAHLQIWLDREIASVVLSNAFGTKNSSYLLVSKIGLLPKTNALNNALTNASNQPHKE